MPATGKENAAPRRGERQSAQPAINAISLLETRERIAAADDGSCVDITVINVDGVSLVRGFARRMENTPNRWTIIADAGRLRFSRTESELLDCVGLCVFPPVPIRLRRRAPPSMRHLEQSFGAISFTQNVLQAVA